MLLCLVTTLSLPPSLRAPGTISTDKSRTPRFDGTALLPVAWDTTLNTSLYSLVPRWGLCACGLDIVTTNINNRLTTGVIGFDAREEETLCVCVCECARARACVRACVCV